MLKDSPYNTLKQDERAYIIMLLRDQHSNTFIDIAKAYGISATRVIQIYSKAKMKQLRLYINHIAAVLGYEDDSQVRRMCDEAYTCYMDRAFICAYFEMQYEAILSAYRCGEPGMPIAFMNNMPPLTAELSESAITKLVNMREVDKASFMDIATEFRITHTKAKHVYDLFYHQQVMAHIKILQKNANSYAKKTAVMERYLKRYRTAKKRHDAILREIESDAAANVEV